MVDRADDSMGGRVRLTDRISIGVLTRVVPRHVVEEVVAYAGRKEKRSRLLPAHVVVYYVLALALFFGEAYEEVMRRLVGGLRFLKNWEKAWKVPTSSALAQARARLGAAPLEELFHRVAVPLARPGTRGAWFRSWRLMAIDGVILDAPDTPENNVEFSHSTGGKGESAFPVIRVVGLGECGTHAIVSAALGTWGTGEQTLVPQLLPDIEPDMLVLADRGFYSYKLYQAITRPARPWCFEPVPSWSCRCSRPIPMARTDRCCWIRPPPARCGNARRKPANAARRSWPPQAYRAGWSNT
jgi:hypothetical protein